MTKQDDSIFENVKPDEDESDEYKHYKKAGELARKVREKSKSWIKVGANILDLAEKIEKEIGEDNIGFPVGIAINEIAAHYTPDHDDKTILTENDIISIDIGTQVEGFIGDTAYSIDLTKENGKLVEASEQALENAISILKNKINTKDIGAEIERTIKEFGFKPVENLGGHGLGQYEEHAFFTIPNVKTMTGIELEEGEIFAIEPFATTGSGRVREGNTTNIFAAQKEIPVRNQIGRQVLQHCFEKYHTLPFAQRWLVKKWPEFQLKLGLRELLQREALKGYPVLHDIKESKISQAEVTVYLEKDSCEILT